MISIQIPPIIDPTLVNAGPYVVLRTVNAAPDIPLSDIHFVPGLVTSIGWGPVGRLGVGGWLENRWTRILLTVTGMRLVVFMAPASASVSTVGAAIAAAIPVIRILRYSVVIQ